jgi:hypothetical protein
MGHINIPKAHALAHLIDDIPRSGTPDNFSTKSPESLHIETCKESYDSTNKRDIDGQILNYLEIQEKIVMRSAFEERQAALSGSGATPRQSQVCTACYADLESLLHSYLYRLG